MNLGFNGIGTKCGQCEKGELVLVESTSTNLTNENLIRYVFLCTKCLFEFKKRDDDNHLKVA